MAISVKKVCKNVKELYQMNLIAGEMGMSNIVKWVHSVEDITVADYLKGYELVFTTGIGNLGKRERLLKFAERLKENNSSGLVINIGPYIHNVPQELIDYCNDNDFPLFTVPWEVKLVEITRSFCEKIIDSEENEKSLGSTMKDFIFYPFKREKILPYLERSGFKRNLIYNVLIFGMEEHCTSGVKRVINEKYYMQLKFYVEKELNKITEKYIMFSYENLLIVILVENSLDKIKELANNVLYKKFGTNFSLHIGIGSNKENLNNIEANFQKALSVYNMSVTNNEKVLFYDDLGVYKIFLSVSDNKILKDFFYDTLGNIVEYDKSTNNNYYEFIEQYIDNDASIQKITETLFVHRNTIHYKIKKIKELTGLDLRNIDDLFLISLCLKINKFYNCTYIKIR